MSTQHDDYIREKQKGEIYGGNAIDSSTAGGRAAQYEQIGKEAMGGGGSAIDGPILLTIAALIVWPIALMAVIATILFFILRRWVGADINLNKWSVLRRLYLACLSFSLAFVASAFVSELFVSKLPASVRIACVLVCIGIGVMISAWALRRWNVMQDDDHARSIRAALCIVLPAIAISCIVLLWIGKMGPFG